jgi:hypothetical protein
MRALPYLFASLLAGCVVGRAGGRDGDAGPRRDAGGRDASAADGGGSGTDDAGSDASVIRTEVDCDDGLDQDDDGSTDCEDTDCANASCDELGSFCIDRTCGGCRGAATETACGDGADEDCDDVTDCADPDCEAQVCGPGDVVCGAGTCPCASGFEERLCGDATDDDCDGMTDCADADCMGRACGSDGSVCMSGGTCECTGSIEFCNGGDEDCNGTVDNGCPRGIATCCPTPGAGFGASTAGSDFLDPCPIGTMLIGIAGRESTRIEQIQPLCAALMVEVDTSGRPDFVYRARRTTTIRGAVHGGTSGTAFEDVCEGDQIALAVRGSGDDVSGVTGISLACGSVSIARSGFAWNLSIAPGGTTPERGAGGTSGGGACPAGAAVTALQGRSGGSLSVLDFTCQALQLSTIQ